MKVCLITDTHWGVRNDNQVFLDNSKRFLDEVFFPYLEENKIDTVIHLGDLVDRRKYINILTANRLRVDFIEPMLARGITYHQIIGNHDTYYKNTNNINSARELFHKYPIHIHESATEITLGETKVLLIPWICPENLLESMDVMEKTQAQIALGHLEIQGFEMYKGSIVSHGYDRNIFSKFDMVISGHYHHRSTDGTIFYLGSHGEFTWSDYSDPRGFHILDVATRDLTFIENPYKVFKKIIYDDTNEDFVNEKHDYSQYKNAMVKIVIKQKNNLYWFDKFVEQLEAVNPIDIQIVEDNLNLNLEEDSDIVNEAESTIDIFKKYIGSIEDKQVDKKKLENKIIELYNEALALE